MSYERFRSAQLPRLSDAEGSSLTAAPSWRALTTRVAMDSPIGLTSSQNLLMTKSSFDELAYALAACARAPSPDSSLTSACKGDDCECCQSWLDVKGKLETKLDLAAKVRLISLLKTCSVVLRHARLGRLCLRSMRLLSGRTRHHPQMFVQLTIQNRIELIYLQNDGLQITVAQLEDENQELNQVRCPLHYSHSSG